MAKEFQKHQYHLSIGEGRVRLKNTLSFWRGKGEVIDLKKMDLKALDLALQDIISKKNELQDLDYNNPKYDDLEEQLHDLEDDFQEKHGAYVEGVLKEVHLKLCPDTDMLYPIAYIAKAYTVTQNNQFDIDLSDGVYVEVDKYPGKETKLALVPNPLRIVLNVGNERQEVVWTT